jgi:hypothetical protein
MATVTKKRHQELSVQHMVVDDQDRRDVVLIAGRHLPRQKRLDLRHESVGLDRLADVAVETGRQQLFAVAHHGQRRHGQCRNILQFRVLLQLRHHAIAIEFGQVHVADDQVRHFAARGFHAFLAIMGKQRLVAEGAEQVHHQLHVGGIVFDDEDAC